MACRGGREGGPRGAGECRWSLRAVQHALAGGMAARWWAVRRQRRVLRPCLGFPNASHGGKSGDGDRQQRGTEENLGMSGLHLSTVVRLAGRLQRAEEARRRGHGCDRCPNRLEAASWPAVAGRGARKKWTGQGLYEQRGEGRPAAQPSGRTLACVASGGSGRGVARTVRAASWLVSFHLLERLGAPSAHSNWPRWGGGY